MEKYLREMQCINYTRLLLLKAKELKISSDEVCVLLYVLELQEMKVVSITVKTLLDLTTYSNKELDMILSGLISKKLIINKAGSIQIHHLKKVLLQPTNEPIIDQKSLVDTFEIEFARGLSPLEIETIQQWKTEYKYEDDIIILALKEAVKSNVLSFRYIEGILHNWKKNGVKQRYITQEEPVEETISASHYKWWE